jgi:type I restriction enzyme S subunit
MTSLASCATNPPLPEGWQALQLGELFAFQNGVNADKSAYGHGLPFINVLEVITLSHIGLADIPGRVSVAANLIETYKVRNGDVLFNRTSETQEEVGLASTFLGHEEVIFGGFVIRGRPSGKRLDPIFSSYALRSSFTRTQIVSRGQGGIRANIGQSDLAQVAMLVPPVTEQRAIAEALSDSDAYIGSLEQLLAKA